MDLDALLVKLNVSQRAAVSCTADQVAILAGPGSGKTHTLTARVAWLLLEGLEPWNIIVATFTKKASMEMQERLGRLLGNGVEKNVIMGTFHSVASRYLQRYGHRCIGLPKTWTICEGPDQLAILKRVVERHKLTIEPSAARSRISGRKSKGGVDIATNIPKSSAAARAAEAQEFDLCYEEYEKALKHEDKLDYDDILIRCVDLLRAHPYLVSNVEAVLIDEFQDTNVIQFELMKLFAAERRRVTIVGDPDQSIYGFRHAETANFGKMQLLYPDTVKIPLEENYRSAGGILSASMKVIQQDGGRIDKSLLATHGHGTKPVLRTLPSAHSEAEWIVTEIQRVHGVSGRMIGYDDVAILLRSAALSRLIEGALGKAGIPYKMVGGHKFYDRVEIKVVLDYLRLIDQPNNSAAIMRVANVPSRRVGDATMKALQGEAETSGRTLWAVVLGAVRGNGNLKTKLANQAAIGLSSFVNVILSGRKKMEDPTSALSTTELIEYVLKKLAFEEYLERTYPQEYETRWANVQELIAQAAEYTRLVDKGKEDDELPQIDGVEQESSFNTLTRFLANIALSAIVEAEDGEKVAQVTISTIHSAKGLEWPVVFIPAAYEGSIPHSRAEDTDEERRLLYVAMTRAKALLYVSHPLKNAQKDDTTVSPFLTPQLLKHQMDNQAPILRLSQLESIGKILVRVVPSRAKIIECSKDLESTEDDLWPLDGTESEREKRRWDNEDTNYSWTKDADGRTAKRTKTNASVTVMEGFTSAALQLQNNLEYEREQEERLVDAKKVEKTKQTKKTKKHVGQNTLHSFFTKPVQTDTSAAASSAGRPLANFAPRKFSRTNTTPFPSQAFKPPILHSSNSLPDHGLPQDIATHRVRAGPAVGSLPPKTNAAKARAVVDLAPKTSREPIVIPSSSPPTSPRLSQLGSSPFRASNNDKNDAVTKTLPLPEPRVGFRPSETNMYKPPIVARSTHPAFVDSTPLPLAPLSIGFVSASATISKGRYYGHAAPTTTTTTTTTTTNGATTDITRTKKTLGVKRSMNGWANRASSKKP